MLSSLHHSARKAGQPPGTPMYTGKKKKKEARINVIHYTQDNFQEASGKSFEECKSVISETGTTWINIEGLNNLKLIEEVSSHYHLHPLTVEDILNVGQRPKVDEFENYLFITIKLLTWNTRKKTFAVEQFSIVLGKNFVISFQEHETDIFHLLNERLRGHSSQRVRQQGSDYLAYRLIDTVVDDYFVVLEGLGETIEDIEELIISSPTQQNTRTLYRLKRKMLLLRKTIWPMREVMSHLLQIDDNFISSFTQIYLRDVYDHVVQAIDNIEIFRDMLSGMVDMYLSSLTNRMNEIMKILTIISTIFIPTTFIASIYGMNFSYMPELSWHYGYPMVLVMMAVVIVVMLVFFRRKKWL